jgi:DNA-binding PadR family transcriptional regulator
MGIVLGVTVSYALLGLLEEADRHGYDLKQSYDRKFGAVRPVRFGQVYRTLAQLERDGLVTIVGVEAGAGPERKRYSITTEGVTDPVQAPRRERSHSCPKPHTGAPPW